MAEPKDKKKAEELPDTKPEGSKPPPAPSPDPPPPPEAPKPLNEEELKGLVDEALKLTQEPSVPTEDEVIKAGYTPEAAKGIVARQKVLRQVWRDKQAAVAATPTVRIGVGDIAVLALKGGQAKMGPRRYHLVEGMEIGMHPDHADELAETGWVKKL